MGAVDILRLKPAFTDEQAEALARLIDENLATKRDIEELKKDLKRDIEALRTDLSNSIDSRTKDLRLEIEKVRWDVAKWVVGMGVVIIGILATVIRLSG